MHFGSDIKTSWLKTHSVKENQRKMKLYGYKIKFKAHKDKILKRLFFLLPLTFKKIIYGVMRT